MKYFLGIDLGASSLGATLVDASGAVAASVREQIATAQPRAGIGEQAPQDWRDAMFAACARLRDEAGEQWSNIEAVAFSGGAHIAVLCNAQGTPLRPAILWSDTRAAEQAQVLQNTDAEIISGNRPAATWTLPQLIWLAEHEPQVIANTARIYFAKDWLRAALTADWQTDTSEAVGSMLWDYQRAEWSPELVKLTKLNPAALPPVVAYNKANAITKHAATQTALPATAKILQGAIDTSMEWLCCEQPSANSASIKLATAGVLSVSSANDKPQPPLSRYPHILHDTIYYAAGMNQCTPALEWVRETLLRGCSHDEMERVAQSAPPLAGGVMFHPYLNGERAPLWDAAATASLSGMSRASTAADIARAAYEGVGFAFLDIAQDFAARKITLPPILTALGGGAQSDFWCQVCADMLGATISRPVQTDASYAAAVFAAGKKNITKTDKIFTPDKINHSRYVAAYQNFKRCAQSALKRRRRK